MRNVTIWKRQREKKLCNLIEVGFAFSLSKAGGGNEKSFVLPLFLFLPGKNAFLLMNQIDFELRYVRSLPKKI